MIAYGDELRVKEDLRMTVGWLGQWWASTEMENTRTRSRTEEQQ